MARCVYLATDKNIADDIADGLNKAADALTAPVAESEGAGGERPEVVNDMTTAERDAADGLRNSLRALMHTVKTCDADERYRARAEGRSANVHTNDLKQSKQALDAYEEAITAVSSRNPLPAPAPHAPSDSADKERLDWLESHRKDIRMVWSRGPYDRYYFTEAAQGCDESLSHATLRQAIDSAMSPTPSPGAPLRRQGDEGKTAS